ncbi:ABC transporter permease [Actinorhabdospora filicis]|uniref:ABC transporter permease n=1 Tax=Actinorhabdospora filicis TaxID=1785913 RepID=A0A9W6SKW7_9ACTN|nr:ABC transporter permease [Actinorhabdospora filicis]GLZ76481.1 ABC transporter permease [Actinorhabdospora filicis]
MFRYIIRRLLQMVLAFFGTTLLVYWLMFAASGDPLAALAGEKPMSPSVRAALTEQFHLDQPFIVQYFYYMKGLLSFDLGNNLSNRDIADLVLSAWPYTLRLAFLAFIFVVVVGIPLGVWVAMKRGGVFDTTVLLLTLVIISIPVFVIGSTLAMIGSMYGLWVTNVGGAGTLSAYLVPAIVLGSLSLATAVRLTRGSVSENLRADYVRTAKAKGLKRLRVVGVHVLRNSLIPVITFLGIELGGLMGGAIVTEKIFNIPGIGFELAKAINLEDGPTVVTIVSLLVIVYLVMNLIVDVLYAVLDPRIRYE